MGWAHEARPSRPVVAEPASWAWEEPALGFQRRCFPFQILNSFCSEAPRFHFALGPSQQASGLAFRRPTAGWGSHVSGGARPPSVLARPLHFPAVKLGPTSLQARGRDPRAGLTQGSQPLTRCWKGLGSWGCRGPAPMRTDSWPRILVHAWTVSDPQKPQSSRRGLRLRGSWGPWGFPRAAPAPSLSRALSHNPWCRAASYASPHRGSGRLLGVCVGGGNCWLVPQAGPSCPPNTLGALSPAPPPSALGTSAGPVQLDGEAHGRAARRPRTPSFPSQGPGGSARLDRAFSDVSMVNSGSWPSQSPATPPWFLRPWSGDPQQPRTMKGGRGLSPSPCPASASPGEPLSPLPPELGDADRAWSAPSSPSLEVRGPGGRAAWKVGSPTF